MRKVRNLELRLKKVQKVCFDELSYSSEKCMNTLTNIFRSEVRVGTSVCNSNKKKSLKWVRKCFTDLRSALKVVRMTFLL